MQRRLWAFVVAVALVAWPSMVGAQETVDMTYTGAYGWNYGGYYVGTYTASMYPGGPSVDVYCVDSAHMVSSSSWTAYVSRLESGSIGNTYLGESALDRYWRAAYLSTKFTPGISNTQAATIHALIWNTTTGALPSSTFGGLVGSSYYNQLQSELASTDYATWRSSQDGQWALLTDVDGNSQEFLTHSSNVVPEPETWAMLLTGLGILGVGVLRGRLI